MPLVRGPQPPARTESEPFAEASSDLTGGDADQRWAAARMLANAPGAVGALSAAAARESVPRVREAIFTSLARIGSAESARAASTFLASDEADLRTAAMDALRAMPSAVRPLLPDLLVNADPDVRILTCDLVRDAPAGEASSLLCRVLDEDAHPNVCAAAVDVLAEVGGPEALPALGRCADRFPDEAFLGFSIRVAAERIGSQPAGPRV